MMIRGVSIRRVLVEARRTVSFMIRFLDRVQQEEQMERIKAVS